MKIRFPHTGARVAALCCYMTLSAYPESSLRQQQQSGSPPQVTPAGQTLRVTAQEVLLDMVVRDRKGRPVLDVSQNEVEVFEDGTKQSVTGKKNSLSRFLLKLVPGMSTGPPTLKPG